MKCPTLQGCVFIKHHTVTTLLPSLKWNHISPLVHLCRTVYCFMAECAELGSSPVFSVVTLDWSRLLFSLNLEFMSILALHQRTHITLLCSIPSPVTLPSILPFNLINMGWSSLDMKGREIVTIMHINWSRKRLRTALIICQQVICMLASYLLFLPFSINVGKRWQEFIELQCNVTGLWRQPKDFNNTCSDLRYVPCQIGAYSWRAGGGYLCQEIVSRLFISRFNKTLTDDRKWGVSKPIVSFLWTIIVPGTVLYIKMHEDVTVYLFFQFKSWFVFAALFHSFTALYQHQCLLAGWYGPYQWPGGSQSHPLSFRLCWPGHFHHTQIPPRSEVRKKERERVAAV